MSPFTDLLVHTGRLERHAAPAADALTGESLPGAWTEVAANITLRVSWSTGSESVGARSDQRGQFRFARIFLDPGSYDIRRGDRFRVTEFAGVAFEVTFQKLVYAATAPHHWEVDVEVVEGV